MFRFFHNFEKRKELMLIRKHGHKIALLIIIVFQLIVAFSFASKKQGFFIDEILSYILSNSYYRNINSPTLSLYDTWTEPDDFTKQVVVSNEHRFSYKSVLFNQSVDVHPPFYYIILHTLSSFFLETFSKWFGLSINLILFVISNIFLFLISGKIFKKDLLALLPCIIWGFSAGAISTILFIRMYMLLTTILLAFVYCHFFMVENDNSKGCIIAVFVLTLLGFMTHYYFLIFAFFWSALFAIYWILQKKRGVLVHYILALLFGLITGLLIFPSSFYHIFRSYRGEEAISNLSNNSDLVYKLNSMLSFLSSQQFYGKLFGIILFIVFLYFIISIKRISSKISNHNQMRINNCINLSDTNNRNRLMYFYKQNIYLLSLVISVIATFTMIALVSPFLTTRYIFFIYPIISVLTIYYIYSFLTFLVKKEMIIICGLLVFFIVLNTLSIKQGQVEFINPQYKEILKTAKEFNNYDCIYITDRSWIIDSNIFELAEFRKTYVLKIKNIENVRDLRVNYQGHKGVILYIDNMQNQEKVISLFLSNLEFERHDVLYSQEFTTTYLVH